MKEVYFITITVFSFCGKVLVVIQVKINVYRVAIEMMSLLF